MSGQFSSQKADESTRWGGIFDRNHWVKTESRRWRRVLSSRWECGLSVPDSEMLISLSEVFETPVSVLIGETVVETQVDDLKVISEKLEIINLQMARQKNRRREIFHWIFITLCAVIVIVFVALMALESPYLGWDYSDPETAVVGVALHAFEFLFVRIAPLVFWGSVVGSVLTRRKAA